MGTTESGAGTVLVITRTLAAPRERVFRAWTEPEELKRWWGAGEGFTTPIAEVDLPVGGRYRLGMKPPDRDVVFVAVGIYRDVQRPSRLVYTLTHEGFVDAQMRDEHGKGWHGCLDRLGRVLADGGSANA